MNEKYPGSLIAREDALLVVIDVQERLVPAVIQKEKLLENIKRLFAFSKLIGLPVVVTEQVKLGATLPELMRDYPEVKPISKVCFDCFLCEPFAEHVRRLGRRTLILTGVEAHICVAQTALHAVPTYTVHAVGDAISSRTTENWTVAVERMRASGVIVTSTEMVIYELLQKAGTEEFKAALALVK